MRLARPVFGSAPAHPELIPGQVDLWRIDLRQLDASRDRLGTKDQARIDRLIHATARRQKSASTQALQAILRRYLGLEQGHALPLSYGPNGKPSLPSSAVEFNLTHSGSLALLGVANTEVGVDTEQVRPIRQARAIAQRRFRPAAAAELQALEEPGLSQAFIYHWTRFEAEIKLEGGTIFRADSPSGQVALLSFEADPSHIGTLACNTAIERLRCFQYVGGND